MIKQTDEMAEEGEGGGRACCLLSNKVFLQKTKNPRVSVTCNYILHICKSQIFKNYLVTLNMKEMKLLKSDYQMKIARIYKVKVI